MSYSIVFYSQNLIDQITCKLTLRCLNYANTLGLCIEASLKICDSGMKLAVKDNTYEMSLCLLSLVDIILEVITDVLHIHPQFISFVALNIKGLRYLKVMRVCHLWKPFSNMIFKKTRTRKVIAPFFVLLLLFVAMYGMIGFEYF